MTSSMNTKKETMMISRYDLDGGIFFSTTRHGGRSKGEYSSFNINEYCGDDADDIAANRRLLCDELGIDETHLVMPHQTHGTTVRQIAEDFVHLPENIRKMILDGVDAVMTDVSGICIGVSTADCIPIIIYDPEHHAVATVHAGWRGTVARIAEKAIRAMAITYHSKPEGLHCVIGPGISLEHFEVGQEVYEEFAEAGFDMDSIAKWQMKWHIDLKECNRQQLERMGVKLDIISVSDICTVADNQDYFSARKQGINSGRIFTGALLNEE